MRKQVETTEDAYFCDICGEQQFDAHWTYGGFATASEELDQCRVCGKDTCHNCGSQPLHDELICKNCVATHKDLIQELLTNEKEWEKAVSVVIKPFKSTEVKLRRKLFKTN